MVPEVEWFDSPTSRRPAVGRTLIRSAQALLAGREKVRGTGTTTAVDGPWADPLVISYLNIGFRRLERSLPGIVHFVLHHRPDVLFLGDLGVARNKVGRLKLTLERDLGDEWFMLTDISAPQENQRSTGMAAVIHCSLARHITTVEPACPEGHDKDEWSKTVAGRVMQLQLSRAECPHTWQLVGLYQYVAASKHYQSREVILSTMETILTRAKESSHRVLLIGDVNSAPTGGRWGYSPSNRLAKLDREMCEWVSSHGCREIQGVKLQATWAMCQDVQRAALDRAFIHPAQEPSSSLTVAWNRVMFDHALIAVRLPHATAGIGYAGACRPESAGSRVPRCKIDLKQWNRRREEWARLLSLSLDQEDENTEGISLDPFQALANGELVAEAIAQKLAPKRIPHDGEVRRSFCFAGHRLLFRELNLLRTARVLGGKVLRRAEDFCKCPHRETRWTINVLRLNQGIRRSGYPCPPELSKSVQFFLGPNASSALEEWLVQARTASEVRHAAIREAYDHARFLNIQNLRYQLAKSGGTLDKQTLRGALGKRQPRQRMWGVSGPAVLGVAFELHVSRLPEALGLFKTMQAANQVVRIVGTSAGLELWFRGPRQAGDFLAQWCTSSNDLSRAKIHALPPPAHYVATDPDDMLAVQEWHMANEGLDTESVCPRCRSAGIQPITTTADHQPCGNPRRAVRFFCAKCRSVHDEVALNPLPPCPLPLSVLQAMRAVAAGTLPSISFLVDYDTLEACARAQPLRKSVGTDRIPRELYKYGPRPFLELLRAAINAYLRGERPTVRSHEWMGAIVTFIAKQMSAVKISEFRPVASICAKFAIFMDIINTRLARLLEDHGLLEDAQEAFRKDRSTQRQLCKLQCLLAAQRKAKSLSVMLFLDIKNAFNAMNHRAIFHIMKLCGFPEDDILLFQNLYRRTFLFMGNLFGESAACFLTRGVPQGAHPSPLVFVLAFNLVHVIARVCGRGSSMHGLDPNGSSGFADDTTFHTDGTDAVSSMQAIVSPAGAYLTWLGQAVNMLKSKISAIDFATGQMAATDNIRLNGTAFPVQPPHKALKQLGVRIAMNNDFSEEKEYILKEMSQRLSALRLDQVLSPTLKELAIKVGVVPVFRYSAGVVPWTKTELELISKLWRTAFKQAWSFSPKLDDSPMSLNRDEGGRECPSATDEWTRAVLDLWEQCICLPGEISRIVTHHLEQTCLDHGCTALNQLQCLLRVGGRHGAVSVAERLLLCLDEQGLVVSSPWPHRSDPLITAALWPQMWAAWVEKQKWAGCRELSAEVDEQWRHARNCLRACKALAQSRIWTTQQLCGPQGTLLLRDELSRRHCSLTVEEYTSLTSWLSVINSTPESANASNPPSPSQPSNVRANWQRKACTAYYGVLPPCIRGRMVGQLAGAQVEMESVPDDSVSCDQLVSKISDAHLVQHLCRSRAVFSFTADGSSYHEVECLIPFHLVVSEVQADSSIVVGSFQPEPRSVAHLAVFSVALIRDTLRDNSIELLCDACRRPRWRVMLSDLQDWYPLSCVSEDGSVGAQRPLINMGQDGQSYITGLSRRIGRRRTKPVMQQSSWPHPWQCNPPLPAHVTIDLSNHLPSLLPSPAGWEVLQRNGRTLITAPGSSSVGLDSAQFGMLRALYGEHSGHSERSEFFLRHLRASCLAQQRADADGQVHWSRHLLARLHRITGAELLIGVRAVLYNPHFQHFVSPFAGDQWLGASQEWPQVPALLLLDSFEPEDKQQLWSKVTAHGASVWVLLQDHPTDVQLGTVGTLRLLGARLSATLNAESLIVHDTSCWSDAKWDVRPARFATQLWHVEPDGVRENLQRNIHPLIIPPLLGSWESRRYDFHWCEKQVPESLRLHQEHQQDALRHSWEGLIVGTDGGVNWKNECMGAGYVAGAGQVPDDEQAVRVGGPLSSLRAEAAGLLQCLIRQNQQAPLLGFVDSLAMLDILQKWGTASFNPRPKDVRHFDVIFPLLCALRQWQYPVRLVKIKSHTGCLMNERADELAERGYCEDALEVCSAPQKYGSLWLKVQPHVRNLAAQCQTPLPRDSAPNRSLLKRVARANARRTVSKRSTTFVRHLLHQSEGAVIARVVSRCREAEYRVWVKAMADCYPVQAYLQRINLVKSADCPYCPRTKETLAHFASVCPQFREARTAAHNQVRKMISSLLAKCLPDCWGLHEETPMADTGLRLARVSFASMKASGRPLPEHHEDTVCVGRLQPDLVLVSQSLRRIAIVEVSRPMDDSSEQLAAAHDRKMRTYTPLIEALKVYLEEGWQVEIFPWVVGIRGLLNSAAIKSCLEFLAVPRQRWERIIEDVAKESVKAFYSQHRVRCKALKLGPRSSVVHTRRNVAEARSTSNEVFDADDPGRTCNRKRKRRTDEDIDETRRRWKQMEKTTRKRG